jgi:hypothetical protein
LRPAAGGVEAAQIDQTDALHARLQVRIIGACIGRCGWILIGLSDQQQDMRSQCSVFLACAACPADCAIAVIKPT